MTTVFMGCNVILKIVAIYFQLLIENKKKYTLYRDRGGECASP